MLASANNYDFTVLCHNNRTKPACKLGAEREQLQKLTANDIHTDIKTRVCQVQQVSTILCRVMIHRHTPWK